MKIKALNLLIMASNILVASQSCEKDENETKISSFNSSESHHMGENCMNCHKTGGPGEGIFKVAGTVYDDTKTSVFPNASVKIYSGANASGALMATIEVDKYGNFYTTKSLDFGNGLYPVVEGASGPKFMQSGISTGACNSCHDSGFRIAVK